MGKYLLLIVGALLIYWIVRAGMRRRSRERAEHRNALQEDMVRCVTCGVHLPRGESLVAQGEFYCCVEHQRRRDRDA